LFDFNTFVSDISNFIAKSKETVDCHLTINQRFLKFLCVFKGLIICFVMFELLLYLSIVYKKFHTKIQKFKKSYFSEN